MAIDNQTAFNYSLGAAALLLWFVMYNFFGFVIELEPIRNIIGPSETATTIIPFILGLGTAAGSFAAVRRHEEANRFGLDVIMELRKVVWPGRKEVTGTTTGVLVLVFITAFILFLFDKLFGYFIQVLINIQ